MAAPTLELARPNDLGILLPLVRAYHAFEGISQSDESRRAAVAPLLGESKLGRIWLIEVDGTPVGYLAICFGYSIEFDGRDAFVDEFFVLESYRGRGIGRAALSSACDVARTLGIKALHLEVAGTNEKAKSLYQGTGFETRDRFHLMSRRLERTAR